MSALRRWDSSSDGLSVLQWDGFHVYVFVEEDAGLILETLGILGGEIVGGAMLGTVRFYLGMSLQVGL